MYSSFLSLIFFFVTRLKFTCFDVDRELIEMMTDVKEEDSIQIKDEPTNLEKAFQNEFNKAIELHHKASKIELCTQWCQDKINVNISSIGNIAYDILTATISIADITTDIWVIVNFYIKKRLTFFWIALIVLIIAQISYAIAFVIKFVDTRKYAWTAMLQWFFFGLLFSPFMSFIFYFTSDPELPLAKIFKHYLDLEIADKDKEWHESWATKEDISKNKSSNITEWIEKKFRKHLGFIMEAVIEAIPQSIIQMIAIVYFQETEWINIVSILISLTSVATKSMVFSYAITFDIFIFNWLSLVSDFFGIFCVLSWVFYNPNNEENINNIGLFWINQTIIIWASICVWTGIFFLLSYDCISEWYGLPRRDRNFASGMIIFCKQVCIWIAGSGVGLLVTSIGYVQCIYVTINIIIIN